jgi:glycosyltransferase involved in cell wall biosynthesis
MHFGGAERFILSLARQFQHCRPCGLILTQHYYHPDMYRRAKQLMPVTVCNDGDSMAVIQAKAAQVCEHADVLVSWGEQRLTEIVRDRRGTPNITCPVVEVSHSDGAWSEQTNLVHQSYLGANALVAVSKTAVSAYPPDVQANVRVLPNGVEVDRLTPTFTADAYREMLDIPADVEKIVLFLGRFAKVKGPEKLMRALGHLPEGWAGIFAGHGPMINDLKELGDTFAPGRYFFVPPKIHVGDLLNIADVLALPSECEGHPLTANEAWLTSTPVVSTDFSFAREINERHGEMMKIVPQDVAPADFAAALVEATSKEHEETVLRAFGAAWQLYTAASMAKRWEEYLATIAQSQAKKEIWT